MGKSGQGAALAQRLQRCTKCDHGVQWTEIFIAKPSGALVLCERVCHATPPQLPIARLLLRSQSNPLRANDFLPRFCEEIWAFVHFHDCLPTWRRTKNVRCYGATQKKKKKKK
eukprot:Polyplicarium_translucidae@DN2661_c0_g1_i3.p3